MRLPLIMALTKHHDLPRCLTIVLDRSRCSPAGIAARTTHSTIYSNQVPVPTPEAASSESMDPEMRGYQLSWRFLGRRLCAGWGRVPYGRTVLAPFRKFSTVGSESSAPVYRRYRSTEQLRTVTLRSGWRTGGANRACRSAARSYDVGTRSCEAEEAEGSRACPGCNCARVSTTRTCD